MWQNIFILNKLVFSHFIYERQNISQKYLEAQLLIIIRILVESCDIIYEEIATEKSV